MGSPGHRQGAADHGLRACERVGQGLKDETWLRDVGEHDWVVLMKDVEHLLVGRSGSTAPGALDAAAHAAAPSASDGGV